VLGELARRLEQEGCAVGGRAGRVRYIAVTGSVEGRTTTLLGFPEGQRVPAFVVKIHRDPAEREAVENERAVLEGLHARGEFFRQSVPRVLFSGRIGGFSVLVQSALAGSPMRGAVSGEGTPEPASARRNIDLSLGWLIRCQRAVATGPAPDGRDWRRLALPAIAAFRAVFDLSREEVGYLDGLRSTVEQLPAGRVPVVLQHGDFSRQNILVSGAGAAVRIGVIDWTFCRRDGLPLHDLVFFLVTYCLQARRQSDPGTLDALFEHAFLDDTGYSRLAREAVVSYCRELGIDLGLVKTLFVLCLIEQALLEYRQAVRALRSGTLPRFTLQLARAEGRPYADAVLAQPWARFFRVFVACESRFVV